MNSNGKFDFTIEPKPSFAKVDITQSHFADFAFTVTNKSERPVRAEAMIIPLAGPADADGNTLPPEEWGHWLELQDEATYDFGPSSVKNYTARVVLPADVRLGEYKFRLIMVNVADPDGPFAQSDVAVFNAVGPHFKVSTFVWWALAAFVALTLLTVLVIVLLQTRTLSVTMRALTETVPSGTAAHYQILIENRRPVTATDIMLVYRPPVGVVGAVVSVVGEKMQQCDELGESTLELIRCDLDKLPPGSHPITVELRAIPGPGVTVITNTAMVTVLATLNGEVTTAPAAFPREQTTLAVLPPASTPGVVVLIDPGAAVATLDEPINYRLLAWTTGVSTTSQVTLTYQLPSGMRYAGSGQSLALPEGCALPRDYFTLVCQRSYDPAKGKPAEVIVKVTPTEILAQAPEQVVRAVGDATVNGAKAEKTAATVVVNSALFFNGRNAYVNLGYKSVPPEGNLTAEMWLHPFAADDGQSFLGAHREENDRVSNLFLLGYWNDGLTVTLGPSSHVITDAKRTERHHLAVTIKRKDEASSFVTVYLNGDPLPWREPDPPSDDCDLCKVFTGTLTTEPTLHWLLGQEWDSGSPDPRPSDFFKGAMSDVRLWNCVRNEAQIEQTMNQHLVGDEVGLKYCDQDERGRLIGYWPLEPTGESTVRPLDEGPNHYDGDYVNTTWGERLQRFGGALTFDGVADALLAAPPPPLAETVAATNAFSLTLSAWLKVESVPTLAEWLVAVPLTLSMATMPPVAAELTEPLTFAPGLSPADETAVVTTTTEIATENFAASIAEDIQLAPVLPPPQEDALPANQAFWALLLIDDDGHVAMVAQPREGGSQPIWDKDEKPIETGRWVHFTGVLQVNQQVTPPTIAITLYRNGALVKGRRLAVSHTISDVNCQLDIYIGGGCPGTRTFFAGQMDEVRLWARSLQEPEINQWLNRPGEVFDEALYLAFDDGPGRRTTDLSRNRQAIALGGPAWIASDAGSDTSR